MKCADCDDVTITAAARLDDVMRCDRCEILNLHAGLCAHEQILHTIIEALPEERREVVVACITKLSETKP